jgi:hypothetical protein
MFPPRPAASTLAKHMYQALCLVLLLIAGQQGAVVHELGHLTEAHAIDLSAAPGHSTEPTCLLCPAFAELATPAVSHSFIDPLLLRLVVERSAEPRLRVAHAAIPTPRSRGPPFPS